MKKTTVTIIGSGSAYTPGIVNSLLARRESLSLGKIVLTDNDERRLHITGDFLKLLVAETAPEIEVLLTADRREAFQGMDYLLAQIRTGLLEQRALDEKIPMKYGVIGQETCGPGGFAFAMREIPAMIEIARDVVRYAPEAWIINYSNPTAIVGEAIHRAVPEAKNICICDVPPWLQSDLARFSGGNVRDFSWRYYGLNHLGWFTHMYDKQGHDLLPGIIQHLAEGGSLGGKATDEHWEAVSKRQGKAVRDFSDALPVSYLQYYYYPDEMFAAEDPDYTRAQFCLDHREKETYAMCLAGVEKGTALGNNLADEIHGDFIVDLVNAIENNTHEEFIINAPNDGIIPNFTQDALVECLATVDAGGYHPLSVGTIPVFQKGLMEVMKAYELLTVEACMEGSYEKALKALTLNPIVPSANVARKILADYMEANKAYWPELK